MARTTYQDLLDAGVHFGHLTRKWDPKMSQYIFMERNGIHIIDLNKTLTKVEEAAAAIKQIVKSGRKVLFVATKKQAKDIVAEYAKNVNMPFITERWLGGMLTNFATVRKSIKKMSNIDFPIPANDDATKSISLITGIIIQAIVEGLEERKREKEDEAEKEAAVAKAKADSPEAAAPATAAVVDRAPGAEGGKRTRKTAVEAEAAVADEAPVAEKEEE
jgi:ribosomal protein S2